MLSLPSWPRHCLRLVFPLPAWLKQFLSLWSSGTSTSWSFWPVSPAPKTIPATPRRCRPVHQNRKERRCFREERHCLRTASLSFLVVLPPQEKAVLLEIGIKRTRLHTRLFEQGSAWSICCSRVFLCMTSRALLAHKIKPQHRIPPTGPFGLLDLGTVLTFGRFAPVSSCLFGALASALVSSHIAVGRVCLDLIGCRGSCRCVQTSRLRSTSRSWRAIARRWTR